MHIHFKEKENDVLALGELLVDLIGKDLTGDSYTRFFGGSPANIAANVKRLGFNSAVASCVGNDDMGRFLQNKLEEMQISTEYIQQSDESTSMVVLRKSTATPIPAFYRGADSQLTLNDKLIQKIKDSKILHFSCWPISQETSRKTVLEAIKIAKENDTLVSFDPNYHPAIWQKGHDAISFLKEVICMVDIAKPSEDDATRIFGEDTNENHIKKFLDCGVKIVALTLGKEGVLIGNKDKIVHLPPEEANVVDTTGAGDAFWSGFYGAILSGYDVYESATIGQKVSAFKLGYVGAISPLPTLKEIAGGDK